MRVPDEGVSRAAFLHRLGHIRARVATLRHRRVSVGDLFKSTKRDHAEAWGSALRW
jgi:hypothetical protein